MGRPKKIKKETPKTIDVEIGDKIVFDWLGSPKSGIVKLFKDDLIKVEAPAEGRYGGLMLYPIYKSDIISKE